MSASTSSAATLESFRRFLNAEPQLASCAPLGSIASMAERTLLHAGPPFERATAIRAPVLNSAIAAVMFEGWCKDATVAHETIMRGDVTLAPAQDHGVVTPLAFVVSPSMSVLGVSDVRGTAPQRCAPINDGPAPGRCALAPVSMDAPSVCNCCNGSARPCTRRCARRFRLCHSCAPGLPMATICMDA
jgi:hypothetical protein